MSKYKKFKLIVLFSMAVVIVNVLHVTQAATSKTINAAIPKLEITNPATWPAYTCVQTNFNLTATLQPPAASGGIYNWEKTGGDAEGTFTPNGAASGSTVFKGTKEGTITIKATFRVAGKTIESEEKQLTVIIVDTLTADNSREIDDGDGNADTKSYYAWVDTGNVKVTAVPKPVVAEADLPACWTLTGGTGAGKLERTVSRATNGQTVITCTTGTKTKQVTVWIMEMRVVLDTASVCDGNPANLHLDVLPNTAPAIIKQNLSNFVLKSKITGTNNSNPAGDTDLEFDAVAVPALTSKIQNGRWFSTQADHCNVTSDYEIEAEATDNGATVKSKNNPNFTVDAGGGCVNGSSGPTQYFSGDLVYTTVNVGLFSYETTVTQGTFIKNVVCATTNTCHANSQYRTMVQNEEDYHTGQMQGTNGHLCDNYWLAANVMTEMTTNQPYTGWTAGAAEAAARAAFETAKNNEIARSNNLAFPYPSPGRCDLEREAKAGSGAAFICTLPCAYPACPP